MEKLPSIFNDVIGPVMRGPSSSHCAAAARIGTIARTLMEGDIQWVRVQFDAQGSLATTHKTQGSDMGLCGGLLGFALSDERLVRYEAEIDAAGVQVAYEIGRYGDAHPNTYRLTLKNSKETHTLVALSTGGGMIEVIEIDGHKLSIQGDLYETLVYFEQGADAAVSAIGKIAGEASDVSVFSENKENRFVRISRRAPLDPGQIASISASDGIISVKHLPPVLPILTPAIIEAPFRSPEQMLAYNKDRGLDLGGLAAAYESARGGVGRKEIADKMRAIVGILRESLRTGLAGTEYRDRILGRQSDLFDGKLRAGKLLDAGILNRAILYVTALMEVKSAMGVIVAAPTAGSCGGLPGAVLAAADEMGCDDGQIAHAMLAAGLIGVFISGDSTFAAEVAGCQAECGAGSGMTAAALVTLMGGSAETATAAASMALQNSLGMICDPVANRVEVPCLGKNVMAASNALACANMALAGYDPVVPLDEVIATMDKVGKSLPVEFRCTALGGLSITETSKRIQARLETES